MRKGSYNGPITEQMHDELLSVLRASTFQLYLHCNLCVPAKKISIYVQCGLWYVVMSTPEFDLRHCLLVLQPLFKCYCCVVTCKLVVGCSF